MEPVEVGSDGGRVYKDEVFFIELLMTPDLLYTLAPAFSAESAGPSGTVPLPTKCRSIKRIDA